MFLAVEGERGKKEKTKRRAMVATGMTSELSAEQGKAAFGV
jgi:hypothetical protein